jgi:F0F1-type ATP synthase epsilon subunit
MVRLKDKPDEYLEASQRSNAANLKLKQKDAKLTMHVKVYAPFRTYYDDDAQSISAVNDTGAFDILPRHHNFMTLVNKCRVVVRSDKGEQFFDISRGIMHVKADQVILFLDV